MKALRSLLAVLAAVASMTVSAQLGAGTPAAAATSICNKYCDARDPAPARQDRHAGHRDHLRPYLALHFDDTDAMGWASIDQRQPGRRGLARPLLRRRPDLEPGSKLGDTTVPAGHGRLAHPDVQRGRLEQPRRRRAARLRQGRRPRRDRLHARGPGPPGTLATGARRRPPR